jgi:uroporphyrinogen-III synthase
MPRLIVTRPAAQAVEWVQRLRGLGVDAVALPLIDIGPPPDPVAVQAMMAALVPGALVMFVSPSAVEQALSVLPRPLAWPAGVRAAATGPGTVRALRAAGVPASQIVAPPADAAQFDSEALWQGLRGEDWRGRPVHIVRGEGGRDWFADTLRQAGAAVHLVQGYVRGAPRLDEAQCVLLAEALARPADHAWLFSSSESIDQLQALQPQAHWQTARALATHPRIAQRARALGFGAVVQVSPDAAVIAAACTA